MAVVGGMSLIRAPVRIAVLDISSMATGRGKVIGRSLEKPVTIITLDGKC